MQIRDDTEMAPRGEARIGRKRVGPIAGDETHATEVERGGKEGGRRVEGGPARGRVRRRRRRRKTTKKKTTRTGTALFENNRGPTGRICPFQPFVFSIGLLAL